MKPGVLLPNFSGLTPEAGCDEAGRGCLMGPVFAAAVILPDDFRCPLLNDSKKLTASVRESLRQTIEQQALSWAVAQVSHHEIDRINILQASIRAMHLALDQLTMKPAFVIVDGNRFRPWGEVPYQCQVKGDGQWMSIAAASILAKTHRDAWVCEVARQYPQYHWESNKGYATASHVEALARHGFSPLHRTTFHLKRQTSLDFE